MKAVKAKKTASKSRTGKSRTPKTFRNVIDLATEDAAYAKDLKAIAAKARTGDPRALKEFQKAFKLTPRALKALTPRQTPTLLFTGLPCTVVVATAFLSCFPRTSIGYHWFCKEAR